MDRSCVVYLIAKNQTQNELGVWEDNPTKRKVYADVNSITQNEWFEGGRNGLNPALRFKMFAPDYNGESVLEYNGTVYTVYRTYVDRNEQIELYTEIRKGNEDITATAG